MAYNHKPTPRKERKPRRPKNPLVGRSAAMQYPESFAQVRYLRGGRMEWRVEDSQGRISTGTERVTYVQIDDHLHMLNWTEKTGFSVSQVIDTHKGRVRAFWSQANGWRIAVSHVVKGSFQFVDGWEGGSLPPKKGQPCTPSKS